jgi:Protein of unknown function (DUF3048).
MRKIIPAILVILITFSCISCNGQSKASNATLEQTTIGSTTVEVTSPAIATPSPVPDIAGKFKLPEEGMRPYAVMIDNQGKKVLPQGGLDLAQVIYEVVVEGGETRLMPVFWGVDPTMIGPVRSSRHYFLDYAMEHDAIYVHFGWSPQAQKDISALKINNINGVTSGGVIFWDLTKDKGNWQDSYTSMENILNYVKKVKYRTTTEKKLVFSYNQSFLEPSNGQKAEKISIKYTSSVTCTYEYDSTSMCYKRLRNGVPHMERVSGEQLRASNILIQYTPNSTIKGDDKGRQEVTTVGSGNGYYITKGKAIKIKWSKQARSSKTEYIDEAGNPILLNPGQTWIQIMPVTAKVTIE